MKYLLYYSMFILVSKGLHLCLVLILTMISYYLINLLCLREYAEYFDASMIYY